MYMCVYKYLCVCMYEYGCIYVYEYMYLCVGMPCLSVFMCISACMCLCMRDELIKKLDMKLGFIFMFVAGIYMCV